MRGEATNAAVPEFFEHQVDEQFRESVAAEVIQAKSDIDAIENLLSQLRGQINGDTDADKLFSRFIANAWFRAARLMVICRNTFHLVHPVLDLHSWGQRTLRFQFKICARQNN